MIEIIDDYLSLDDYGTLYNYWIGNYDNGDIANSCVWAFNDGISAPGDGHFQFVHQIFAKHNIISPAFNIVKPIIEREDMVAIARIKANSICRTDSLIVFDWAFHCDFDPRMEHMTTAIYYINTCDGYTLFEDGTKIDSVANRLVKFPANLKHTGTTCTDTNRRILINFNYFS